MTTTITKSVGTTGRDYSTITSAWNAVTTDIVAADEVWVFELYNDSEFVENFGLSGKTTDATHTITFKCGTGQSFNDNVSKRANALRYNQSNGVAIKSSAGATETFLIGNGYVVFDGLQFSCVHTGCDNVLAIKGALGCTVKNCIVSTTQTMIFSILYERAGNVFTNLLVYGDNAPCGIYAYGKANFGVNTEIHNCTVAMTSAHASTHAIDTVGAGAVIKNTAGFGFSKFADVNTGSGGFNCGDDSISSDYPGSSNQITKTFANQFTSITLGSEDFSVLLGADLINNGTRDQTYTADLDITKTARDLTTPSIGCWEYGATNTSYYLGSDIGTGGWTTSTGSGTLASMADEIVRDDADYIQSAFNPSADIAEMQWANVQPPALNTSHALSYVIKGDATTQLIVSLIAGNGSTIVKSWTHVAAPGTFTRYDRTIGTATAGTWASAGYVGSRLRLKAG